MFNRLVVLTSIFFASCEKTDVDSVTGVPLCLLPLNQDNQWIYTVSEFNDASGRIFTDTSLVTSQSEWNGSVYWSILHPPIYYSWCSSILLSQVGDSIVSIIPCIKQDSTLYVEFLPYRGVDTSFTGPCGKRWLSYVDTVTTPAGTFSDCYLYIDTSGAGDGGGSIVNKYYVKPGVGVVRYLHSGTFSTTEADLVSYVLH